MRTFLPISLILLLSTSLFSQGLEGVIVEKYYVSDAADAANTDGGTLPVGSITYRFYADMKPGYTFQVLYGLPVDIGYYPLEQELRFETTTKFFNNSDRGAKTANDVSGSKLKDNTVMLDSWLSVGASSSTTMGVLKDEDDNGAIANGDDILKNTDASAGIPISIQDGNIVGTPKTVTTIGVDTEISVFETETVGAVFSTTTGSIASLEGSTGPTSKNRVLFAQITTNGILKYNLNIQIGKPTDGNERYVGKNFRNAHIQREKTNDFYAPGLFGTLPNDTKPVVAITSIRNNQEFLSKKEINLTSTASDADGIDSVVYLVNGMKIVSVMASPYTAMWTPKDTGKYEITSIAIDKKGGYTISEMVMISVKDVLTTVEESTVPTSFECYPNPASDVLTISLNENSNSVFEIKNLSGGTLLSGTMDTNATQLEISALPQGYYIVHLVSSEGARLTQSFIKK